MRAGDRYDHGFHPYQATSDGFLLEHRGTVPGSSCPRSLEPGMHHYGVAASARPRDDTRPEPNGDTWTLLRSRSPAERRLRMPKSSRSWSACHSGRGGSFVGWATFRSTAAVLNPLAPLHHPQRSRRNNHEQANTMTPSSSHSIGSHVLLSPLVRRRRRSPLYAMLRGGNEGAELHDPGSRTLRPLLQHPHAPTW